jgi:hypothetical protein
MRENKHLVPAISSSAQIVAPTGIKKNGSSPLLIFTSIFFPYRFAF